MNRNSWFSFVKYNAIIFSVFSVIDSIVYLIESSVDFAGNNDEQKTKNTKIIVIMCARICVSLVGITVMCIESSLNKLISIPLTLIYGVSTVVFLFMSAIVINYKQNAIISLIVHIVTSYLALSMAYKLIQVNFGYDKSSENPQFMDENKNVNITETYEKNSKNNNKTTGKKTLVERILNIFDENLIAFATIFTVFVAMILGIILRNTDPEEWDRQRSIKYIGFLGEIFFRMIKSLILPLIFTSLVFAMANIDAQLSGKIGSRTFIYYMVTTVLAMILGIIIVISIKPGSRATNKLPNEDNNQLHSTTEDTVLDFIRNLFPDNIIVACYQTYQTVLIPPENESSHDGNTTSDMYDWDISSTHVSAPNLMGMVMFAITFGVIIGQMRVEDSKPLLDFFKALLEVIMNITGILIQLTPIAVLFLVLPHILSVENVSDLLASLGWYALCCVIGMLIHGFIVLPLLFFIVTRKNPFNYLLRMSSAAMTAFGTASSSATMPVTIQCLEEKCLLDSRIVRFVIPLGATVNMDGTALYEAVAAIFIAQYRDIDLSVTQIVMISIIGTAASVGAAGIPSAGPVTLIIVLNSVGLPVEDAFLIYVVDWFVDRFRTALNVMGDGFGAGVVHHLSEKDLQNSPLQSHLHTIS